MGKTKHVREYLAEATFFAGMEAAHLDLLSGYGELMHFNAGDFLLKEGETADCFYLTLQGDVSIESYVPGRSLLIISKVGAAGLVGYSWLFPPYRNAFDARAVTEVKAVRLNGSCLRGKAEEDHELGYQLMKRFAAIMLQRMQATRRQMLDVYGKVA